MNASPCEPDGTIASLAGEGVEPSGGRPAVVDALGPGEPTAQPTGGGDDGRLPARVVDGLAEVVLAVELDEQAEGRPGEVDPGHELSVLVDDDDLPFGRW